ncbi:hypothetical protein ACMWEF_001567 [Campylobacter jejuni]|nr:hypothetical protein [Campylobacter jejuni]ECP7254771.1 hypothetical protein [Campylobacter jejuni]ECP7577831.1 hypothetical protein [Campylobacter jejuni]EEP3556528.1 hypothetical protein [Campylobacter jejuni]EGA8608690.1 hypothetical protein [Campylobacter jejuni]EGA8646410.1 hypothetical protein [Campylobacter jejuni]
MKKQIVGLFLTFALAVNSNAVVWSLAIPDGWEDAILHLLDVSKELNDKSKNKWNNDIKPLIEQIKEETNKKKKLLEEINALEKENSKSEKNMIFLLKQEKKLLGNSQTIISTTKDLKDASSEIQ